jgi:hypothetical protein
MVEPESPSPVSRTPSSCPVPTGRPLPTRSRTSWRWSDVRNRHRQPHRATCRTCGRRRHLEPKTRHRSGSCTVWTARTVVVSRPGCPAGQWHGGTADLRWNSPNRPEWRRLAMIVPPPGCCKPMETRGRAGRLLAEVLSATPQRHRAPVCIRSHLHCSSGREDVDSIEVATGSGDGVPVFQIR